MLHAVLHGKAGRIEIDGQNQSWRELFRQFEDLLTAVFVGRFQYLSDQGLTDVLNILLDGVDVESLGKLNSIEYWPKHEGVENRSFVEPDIIIRFSQAILLIEVKRPDGIQSYLQWSDEMTALLAQDEVETKTNIVFLALGGVGSKWQEDARTLKESFSDINLSVCAKNWVDVNDEIRTLSERSDEQRDSCIYLDWLEAFQLYGLRTKVQPYLKLRSLYAPEGWRKLIALLPVRQIKPSQIFDGKSKWDQLLSFDPIDHKMVAVWK